MRHRKTKGKKTKVKTSNKAWSAESFIAYTTKKDQKHRNKKPSNSDLKGGKMFYEQMRLVDDWSKGIRSKQPLALIHDKKRFHEDDVLIDELEMPIEFKPGKVAIGSAESRAVMPKSLKPRKSNVETVTPEMLKELKKKKKKRELVPIKTIEDLEDSQKKGDRQIAQAHKNQLKLEAILDPEKLRRQKNAENDEELMQVRRRARHGEQNKAPPDFSAVKNTFIQKAKVLQKDFHKKRSS
ncbi:MAG: uncharacterized protein KVP18_002740 [Porospora cf. gigantea A]|uniref:uncharacterized protein n=1 Tax=Porospora cf. gigantea A TaxID=2853593 RepID=UPI003559FBD2|nr:MAG: hypothetical protein KVP18_002740 [Porospora cf. gigantea A]